MLETITMPSSPVLIEDLGKMYASISSKEKRQFGIFKCSCGKEFKAQMTNIKNGHTKSCGCFQKKRASDSSKTHSMSKGSLYNVWNGIIQRCTNSNNKSYQDYGNKGIKVCHRWNTFEGFFADMGESYKYGLSIDRINPNGNYEPSNCRWVTKNIQARNTRKIMSTNTSGYRGVSFRSDSSKWRAIIVVNKKHISIGTFNDVIEAAKAYDNYVITNGLEHTINFPK